MMEKSWARALIKSKKNLPGALDATGRCFASVEAMPQFQAAGTVLLYWSLPDEVDTHGFIQKWAMLKRIVLPEVVGDSLVLRVLKNGTMKTGAFGIMEPCGEVVDSGQIDFAIIPGMAFDFEGHRLGRGRGFYDRLLPSLKCPKVGVCFECQILPSIPVDDYDANVDVVITE